jgi:hypothetical protein
MQNAERALLFLLMRYVLLCLAAFTFAGAAPLRAQTLRGRVTDAESGAGMRSADVILVDSRGREPARATSDTAGFFHLRARRAGSYRVSVSLLGYTPFTSEPIEVKELETVQVGVKLSTRAVPLDPLVITARQQPRGHLADFEKRRQRSGAGYFITQQQIDAQNAMSATAILRDVPHVTLLDASSFGERVIALPAPGVNAKPCRAHVFIDGLPLIEGSFDQYLNPDWVGAVEVYVRPEQTPVQFFIKSDPRMCGTVLFWTREPVGGRKWSWAKFAVAAGFMAGGWLIFR